MQKMNDEIKQALFNKQLEICDYVLQFCKKHNLIISVSYGTLLGTIRHKGFIPWDHDIDLMMPRNEYNRFLDIWQQENHPYFLQTMFTDANYPLLFAKVRDTNTTYIEKMYSKQKKMNQGIFIDIFPYEETAKSSFKQTMQANINDLLLHILCSRLHTNNKLKQIIEKVISLLSDHELIIKQLNNLIVYLQKSSNHTCFIDYSLGKTSREAKYTFDHLFDEIIYLEFESIHVPCVKCYDTYLSKLYGDYMTPPNSKSIQSEESILMQQIIDPFKSYKTYLENNSYEK